MHEDRQKIHKRKKKTDSEKMIKNTNSKTLPSGFWVFVMVLCLVLSGRVVNGQIYADYRFHGLAAGTTTISSSVNTATTPVFSFPGKFDSF